MAKKKSDTKQKTTEQRPKGETYRYTGQLPVAVNGRIIPPGGTFTTTVSIYNPNFERINDVSN